MVEFLKAPFLVLHFSYCALMTFLMILSVILLSMLIIILSILSVLRHLICGNNQRWLLILNRIYKIPCSGAGNRFLISMLEKVNVFRLIGLIIDLEEKSSFKMLGLSFSSKLDQGSYIASIAKTAFKRIRASSHSVRFLSPEVTLYPYKSTIWPCIEYCCHVQQSGNEKQFCFYLQRFSLYFKDMPNQVGFHKRIFKHVIAVPVIVP